jgi:hypothetical protein
MIFERGSRKYSGCWNCGRRRTIKKMMPLSGRTFDAWQHITCVATIFTPFSSLMVCFLKHHVFYLNNAINK